MRTHYNVRDAISEVLRYLIDNRRFIINALKNTSGQNSFLNYVSKIHFTVLRDFITDDGAHQLPRRIELLAKLYVFGTVQLTCEWLINKMSIPLEEFSEILSAGLPQELAPYLSKHGAN